MWSFNSMTIDSSKYRNQEKAWYYYFLKKKRGEREWNTETKLSTEIQEEKVWVRFK